MSIEYTILKGILAKHRSISFHRQLRFE